MQHKNFHPTFALCFILALFLGFALTVVPPSTNCAHAASTTIVIERFVYDGTQTLEGDEYVKLYNMTGSSISLSGYKIGDEETQGGGEGMYNLQGTIAAGGYVIIARNANCFNARFGFLPDYEMVTTDTAGGDNASVPNLTKYSSWASGAWTLANTGDEIVLLSDSDAIVDSVAWGNGDYAAVGLATDSPAPDGSEPRGLKRNDPSVDTDRMGDDFNNTDIPTTVALSSLIARGEQSTAPSKQALAAIFRWSLTALLGLAAMGASIIAFRRQRGA